ncbi:MAG: DNA-3-methyladenine glycosidase II [Candidatus Velthaea sp.]
MRDSVRALTVPVRAPFRLDLTATALRRLSTNIVDVFDGTSYRRLIGDPSAPALLEVTQTAPDALRVRVFGESEADVASLVTRMLGTNVDLDRFYRAAQTWPWLHAIVQNARGVKPPRYPTLWEAMVNAVVFQQVSIHAAAAILRRVIECYTVGVRVEGVTIAPFAPPRAFVDADPVELRALGLSINKVVALRTLGRAVLEGELDERELEPLATPDLTARLEGFKGIGPWTAAVIALRGFGRLDVFPMKDSGVARSLRDLSGDLELDAAPLLAALGDQRGMLYYHLLLGRLAARGEISW